MNHIFTFQHKGLTLEVGYFDFEPIVVTHVIAFQIGQTIKQPVKRLTKLYNCSARFKAMIDNAVKGYMELCNEDSMDHYFDDEIFTVKNDNE